MTVQLRTYTGVTGYTEDFHALNDFLWRVSRDEERVGLIEWVFWEWQTARDVYRADELAHIGLWFDERRIVAATPYEDHMNAVALCADREHRGLLPDMLRHAETCMAHDGAVMLIIDDADAELQRFAYNRGFRATQEKAHSARLDITDETTRYSLPEGFRVIGFDEEFDVLKYNRALWYGFNHGPDAPPEDDDMLAFRSRCVSSPNGNRRLMTVVVTPDGEYAAHCTMWYRGGANAIVEPVATHPQYRRMGLGRAAVLEAARRCGSLGARRAFVNSSQQFYYGIGFYPVRSETFWRKTNM